MAMLKRPAAAPPAMAMLKRPAAAPPAAAPLTEEALKKKAKEMTLDEKMSLYREQHAKGCDMEELFELEDFRKIYGRFTTAREAQPNNTLAKDHWSLIQGKGQNAKKRSLALAYVLDPKLGDAYVSVTQDIMHVKTVRQQLDWCSKAKFLREMGESEGEEMIDEGRVETRPKFSLPRHHPDYMHGDVH